MESNKEQKKRYIEVCVERPNGSTFVQKLLVTKSVKATLREYNRQIGYVYRICDYWNC